MYEVGMGTCGGLGGGFKSHKQTDGCGTLACSHSGGAPRFTSKGSGESWRTQGQNGQKGALVHRGHIAGSRWV